MGCVSSAFLEDEDRIIRGPSSLGHHIVSHTSTTYGLLTTLNQPPPQCTSPPPAPRPLPPPPLSASSSTCRFLSTTLSEPEVINSWDLKAGLDSATPTKPPRPPSPSSPVKENPHSFLRLSDPQQKSNILRSLDVGLRPVRCSLEMFEKRCPPAGAQAAVLYTTTLRVVRKTLEDCNPVLAAVEGLRLWVRERDVPMDLGFRERDSYP